MNTKTIILLVIIFILGALVIAYRHDANRTDYQKSPQYGQDLYNKCMRATAQTQNDSVYCFHQVYGQ